MQKKTPHSPILPCKRSSCSTKNTSQKASSQQARIVTPSHGHCRTRGALTLLFLLEQLGARGCHRKFRCFTCAGTELGKGQKKPTAAERHSLCCRCPVPGFPCKPEENPGKGAGLSPVWGWGMMDPRHWGQVALPANADRNLPHSLDIERLL